MNNKVKFLRGTSDEYAVAEKDSDAIYFTTDDRRLYIGDKEISGDGGLTIDDALSDTSTNPVQGNVIKQAIDNKADKTVATTSTDGLMSAADKKKLDGLSSGGSSSWISGAYTGDGSKTRTISLGFRPCAVIISTVDGSLYYKNTGVLVVDGYIGCTHNTAGAVQAVEIIDSGFKFLTNSINLNGEVYFYIAFK